MGKVLFGFLMCIPILLWGGYRIYKDIIFDRDVTQHLKRAADANSIELAKQELKTVLDYCNLYNLKQGYTSVLYNTPDEDIGFWYQNISTCYNQIIELPPSAKQGEQDLVLMKLRQTLLDHHSGHEVVTKPSGLAYYPNNVVWGFWFLFVSVLACGGALLALVGFNEL